MAQIKSFGGLTFMNSGLEKFSGYKVSSTSATLDNFVVINSRDDSDILFLLQLSF